MEFLIVALLVTVSVCGLNTDAVGDDSSSMHPVSGVQMCKTKCEKTVGCRCVFYDITHLMCKLAYEETKHDRINFRYHWTNVQFQVPVKTCHSVVDGGHFFTVETRRGSTKCIDASIRASEGKLYAWSSLLILTHFVYGVSPFYKMDLKDGTIKAYPYFNFSGVSAVAYVNDLRLVLVCTKYPGRILSTKLDTYGDAKTLKYGISVCCLTVDQRMLSVFLGQYNNSLGKMSLRNHALIQYDISEHIYSLRGLAVESGKKLYVAAQDCLVLFSYELKYLKKLDQGFQIASLTLSLDQRNLYYQNNNYIKKLQISVGSISRTVKLSQLYPIVCSIVNLNDSLYITYDAGERKHMLDVVNMKHSTHIRQAKSHELPIQDGAMLCPV